MKTAYDLTMELIQVMGDLERVINKKAIASVHDQAWLEKDINRLELRMFEIKKTLKNINVL